MRVNLNTIQIGTPASFRNLVLFPLMYENEPKEPGYLLLDEAIERQSIVIKEVSQTGSVPDLMVTNSADLPVLIMDGEELVGAKQNRVLNLSVLVAAQTTIRIPVSCVEAGRWAYESSAFRSSPHSQYASGRAARAAQVTHSLKTTGECRSNQIAVWAELEEKASRLGTCSPTGAMMAMYLEHAPEVEEYAQAFGAAQGQRGAVFAINGVVEGVDLFDHSRTFHSALAKLIRGYALDAIDCSSTPRGALKADSADVFLKLVSEANCLATPAVGIGEDLRLISEQISGGALLAFGELVHLFAFRRHEGCERSSDRRSRMARPSWRRGNTAR